MKSLIKVLIFVIIGISSANAKLDFKTKRIEKEYAQLSNKNEDLKLCIDVAEQHSAMILDKPLIITGIYRTQEEQDRYYKGKKKFRSPHQDWIAVDIRTRHMTEKEIKSLVNFLNFMFNDTNTYNPTAFYHDMGLGKHIHMQFKDRK